MKESIVVERGGACSGPCLETLLPDRHRHLLDQEFPTDPAADPTGQIRVGGIVPVGPADSRLAEVWACDWDPGQCRSVERAAAIVNSLLPDSGDGSQNNAERHALLSAVYYILEFDTDGPDAHENLFGSQLVGYLNDLRLMDLINNEIGFDIARGCLLSPDAAPIDFFGSKLPLKGRSIDSQVPMDLLGLVREASDERRLVWLP